MPPLNLFSWGVWVSVIVGQAAVVFLMARNGSWRRWKALFTLLSTYCLQSFILLAIVLALGDSDLRSLLYFLVFWIGAAITAALQIWLIVEVCCAVVGISDRARLYIARTIPVLALLNLAWAVTLVVNSPTPFYSAVMRAVTYFDRSVGLAWLATFMLIALLSEIAGLQWLGEARGTALGLVMNSLSCTLAAWIALYFPGSAFVSELKGLLYLAALAFWGSTFAQTSTSPKQLPSPEALVAAQRSYFRLLSPKFRGFRR